jgi:rSAM/selenodomain-associated transferase 1
MPIPKIGHPTSQEALRFMNKSLIIVFAKNPVKGRVKTRLAKSIGDDLALEIYETLLKITESATQQSGIETWVFFTGIIDKDRWPQSKKFIQKGADLGQKMQHAFNLAFDSNYESVVLIGSDLPNMHQNLLLKAFDQLKEQQVVFGPASDGGYYLIGLHKMIEGIFTNKAWSTENLLTQTLTELEDEQINYGILETLNDIDTIEDLKASDYFKNHEQFHKHIK